MLNLLNNLKPHKSGKNTFEYTQLNTLFQKIIKIYGVDEIDEERKSYFCKTIEKFGYLPYPQYKALEELSDAEAIYCLIKKMELEGSFFENKIVEFSNPSPLFRRNIKNSSWFKKEGHNIKLLSLSALGNDIQKTATFIDWIKELITLDRGSKMNNIMPCTIYLIPFTNREFDCAYLPKNSEISKKLLDTNLMKFLGLDETNQVKLFITLAQLSGHPVIYDILPQTCRYSTQVLSNPSIARWMDINELINSIENYIEALCANLIKEKRFKQDDILETKKLYIQNLKGTSKKYPENLEKIKDYLEEELKEYKILVSYKMTFLNKQKELVKRVEKVVDDVCNKNSCKQDNVFYQDEITTALINEGLWPLPGGAWCSCGPAIFDKMTKKYPLYKHYNYKSEDVTKFANLDCQTPYFFYHFELNKYNKEVVNYFINYAINLQKEFNFDGFRVDHVDHIADDFSIDKQSRPISYRIPSKVLGQMNAKIKKQVPYFATLAEYMLWDGLYKQYHKDMKFDLLWGDDIVSQASKTPEQIINDNLKLSLYNQKFARNNNLSILKTYNNQDGEFKEINQYPGQLGQQGALFKWFKYKFIPAGKWANRPTLFVDGDESFTKTGIEKIISKEISMERNNDWKFFEKFNAINFFAQNDRLLNQGRANLIEQKSNGFCAWEINFENKKDGNYGYLVVANCLNPTEIKQGKNVKGKVSKNNTLKLKKGSKLVSYFDFELDENQKCMFVEHALKDDILNEITFEELNPAEFKVYKFTQTL